MEKSIVESFPTRKGFTSYRHSGALALTAAMLSFILLNTLFGNHPIRLIWNSIHLESYDDGAVITPLTFEWSKVIPSTDLRWHSCGERRECARLELPIDHLHPHDGTIAVALVRIPATVSHEEYRGPILVNPGGPGNSGVAFADRMGDIFQRFIGQEYDIVGFDPRGVGATTPKISNFLDDTERELWIARAPPLINISNLPDTLPMLYSRADIFGQLALARSKHVAEYVSTVAVARDMLNITNAFGFEKLKYWGFSYGSLLGGTFAAMLPSYVERLIVDGVVDYSDYYSGRWTANLVDTDKVLNYIFEACASAGRDNCPLYEPTPSKIWSRLDAILNSLKHRPIAVLNGTDYTIIEYQKVKSVLFAGLYSPFNGLIESLFEALAGLEKGNTEPMMRLLINLYKPVIPLVPAKCGGIQKSDIVPVQLEEGAFAVRCGESLLAGANDSYDDLREYLEKIGKDSVFADLWSQIRVGCSGWRIRVKGRYEGDFENKTTAFPLLFIGNTLDPVTPLIGAKKVSEGFRNSVLLTVDTPGHCSYAGMSPEALKHIRNYFRDGILPPIGTVCPIEQKLFVKNGTVLSDFSLKGEERELTELAREFVEGMHDVTRKERTKGFYL